jgi:putative zinc ribbon protein
MKKPFDVHMKRGKGSPEETKARRAARTARRDKLEEAARWKQLEARGVLVNPAALAPNKSYGAPAFVYRGYYVDVPFRCKDCGKDEIWTATQQKWWYEVAKGFAYSTATRCRPCRRKDQARRTEARRTHLDGVARKPRKGA